jgi:uncharacterized protein (TIGR03435 family)
MRKLVATVLLAFAAHTALAEYPAQAPEVFEVVSIKPVGEAAAEALARFGGGCDGGFPRVDHNRFMVTTTLYALMTWAYGFNNRGGCSFVSYGELISGGPAWVKSERFQIQALMPEGSTEYTTPQFLNGDAPKLEVMIKNLLNDRFHLTIHRETREVSGYALVVGKDGPKISASTPEASGSLGGTRFQKKPDGTVSQIYLARKTTMTYVALNLGIVTRRPVVDRTGLSGDFTFDLEFAPMDPGVGESSAASVYTAVQEQLGLKLEPAKMPVEVMVIDRAEKPSEN